MFISHKLFTKMRRERENYEIEKLNYKNLKKKFRFIQRRNQYNSTSKHALNINRLRKLDRKRFWKFIRSDNTKGGS